MRAPLRVPTPTQHPHTRHRLNLLILSIFKYADFFTEPLFSFLGQEPHSFGIVLPLGISSFTFQQVSYLADLRRDASTRLYSFREYALFVTFFPQLIAGPIVRHNEIIDQFPLSPLLWSRGSWAQSLESAM